MFSVPFPPKRTVMKTVQMKCIFQGRTSMSFNLPQFVHYALPFQSGRLRGRVSVWVDFRVGAKTLKHLKISLYSFLFVYVPSASRWDSRSAMVQTQTRLRKMTKGFVDQ
ncbi:hypothetical protein DdX_17679 [Ditylenchus destructor]|uniref:Uncharacterized protein n=1 Tax=Ditylenchus destructor TaxID=166010 RepID=A0AAD4QVK7_9BILA|nr:hypothetical protein DdX_17679 [Ditylenchus destructor]